jgi:6-pyruvoyltetrahydropterin/6-carboxytetrahydropterin synthase
MEIIKSFRFEAAHYLPKLPETHKCRRMHGHSFKFDVHVEGPLDPELGWVMDFGDISRLVKPLVEELDHYLLNEIPGLENPTSEVIAVWIWNRLKPELPGLARIVVYETCTARCEYRG